MTACLHVTATAEQRASCERPAAADIYLHSGRTIYNLIDVAVTPLCSSACAKHFIRATPRATRFEMNFCSFRQNKAADQNAHFSVPALDWMSRFQGRFANARHCPAAFAIVVASKYMRGVLQPQAEEEDGKAPVPGREEKGEWMGDSYWRKY
jgi:hypothetical protein